MATRTTRAYRDALMLALVAEVVSTASNIRFGPEPYCGPKKKDSGLLEAFSKRVRAMAGDLALVGVIDPGDAVVFEGDSRECGSVLGEDFNESFTALICSPPYPAEHDYTRHARWGSHFLKR